MILPRVLYESKTLFLTLRRIFGHEREEVKGEWRKLHNEAVHNFYSSSNQGGLDRRGM
jgi:hypothetical protein